MGSVADLVLAVLFAGIAGTIVMDLGNHLLARVGLISKIDLGMIGRMAGGWVRGRFLYGHPSEMEEVPNESLVGFTAHYLIGLGLAVPYVVGWHLWIGGDPSPAWAVPYGLATTVASWFFVYPSMGFGPMGMGSPDGPRAPVSSFVNHFFYGLGLAAGLVLM